jgi:hypothetical protein
MFAGYDVKPKFGLVDFHIGLVQKWEKPKELKRIWNLSIIHAVNANQISWAELGEFKKDFRQGAEYKRFKTRNTMIEVDKRYEQAKEDRKRKEEAKKQRLIEKLRNKSNGED